MFILKPVLYYVISEFLGLIGLVAASGLEPRPRSEVLTIMSPRATSLKEIGDVDIDDNDADDDDDDDDDDDEDDDEDDNDDDDDDDDDRRSGGSSGRAVGYYPRGPGFDSQSGPSQIFIAPLCPPSTKWVARSLKIRRK
ncbi:hypothetical protein PoB_006980400 [Plakobranchus ocellatus]|uniref:Uncharacterized protein n=1 Tax=Plakobranchus ocellatus TaxID=259542 RepID=A0AAV4DGL6_9GAST|nr:hypothetical protein PoB_006980400 [Plakobranchus ocellatus]